MNSSLLLRCRSNPIESVFATVRHRTVRTKRALSSTTAKLMVFKLDTSTLTAYLVVILGLAVTPGPNMIYLISRSIAQGRTAGIVSLGGSALGFVVYMACAAFGITALLLAVPMAYEALRMAGAGYLMVLLGRRCGRGAVHRFRSTRCRAADIARFWRWGS